MATLESVQLVRWNLIKSGIAYNHDFAFPTYWRAHPEVGSPIGPEVNIGNGVIAQPFTGCVLKYENGEVTVVTE